MQSIAVICFVSNPSLSIEINDKIATVNMEIEVSIFPD